MTPVGSARERFSVKFYLVAMVFILFDIEAIFLYPWAVVYRELKLFAFVEMLLFIALVLCGFFYIWKKGVLDWSVEEQERRSRRQTCCLNRSPRIQLPALSKNAFPPRLLRPVTLSANWAWWWSLRQLIAVCQRFVRIRAFIRTTERRNRGGLVAQTAAFRVVYHLHSIRNNNRIEIEIAGCRAGGIDSVTSMLARCELVRARSVRFLRHYLPRSPEP